MNIKNVDKLHDLLINDKLRDNEYISIDYPSDMNPKYENLFIAKTNANNSRYFYNPKYILTIQSKWCSFESFKNNFQLNEWILKTEPKILALGNLCRIMRPNSYTDKVFEFIMSKKHLISRLHVYGMGMRLLRKYGKMLDEEFEFSIDSTKWTRAVNNRLKKECGYACNRKNRLRFFLE